MTEWAEIIKTIGQSPICTYILEELWENDRLASTTLYNNKNKANTTTKLRLLVSLELIKLAGNRSMHGPYQYELTSLGKVVCCLVLGKFKDKTPNTNYKPVIMKDPIFVGREEEIKETIYNLERRRDTLITGPRGAGKTRFLQHLAKNHIKNAITARPRPAKTLLSDLAKNLGLKVCNKSTLTSLLDNIKKDLKMRPPGLVIIINEADTITRECAHIMTQLSKLKIVFLCAARTEPRHYEFTKKLELEPLTKEESIKMIQDLLQTSIGLAPQDIVETLAKRSGGLPGKITKKCENVEIGADIGDFDPKNKESRKEFVQEMEDDEPVINIGKNFFMKLAYFLLSIKFLLYMKRDYKTGYAFATAAYLIFTMFRYWGKKKK